VTAAAVAGDELVTVRILRFPLELWARSSEHHEGLLREFALLRAAGRLPLEAGGGHDVPLRLQQLVDALTSQYAEAVSAADDLRDEALARGDATIDLEYQLPRAAGVASEALLQLLAETDEFCRRGQDLLTTPPPPDQIAFREWYLGEFTRQLAGEPPTPWPGPLD